MGDPSKLADYSNLRMFKKGVRPLWEDPANMDGGKWVLIIITFIIIIIIFIFIIIIIYYSLNHLILINYFVQVIQCFSKEQTSTYTQKIALSIIGIITINDLLFVILLIIYV